MNWKKILLWGVSIILGGGAIIGASILAILLFMEKKGTLLHEKSSSPAQETQDFSTEVVNQPLSEDIVQLEDGTNGHKFIANWHNFYNDSLGWGKLDTANYFEQKEAASNILVELESVSIQNKQLKKDFEQIKKHAEIVTAEDNRNSIRDLHRYFHDLDIYFNGYDYKETFGITAFIGE